MRSEIKWRPHTPAGFIAWLGLFIALSLFALGRLGLAAISSAVYGGAWAGDVAGQSNPVTGQLAMLVGALSVLIASVASIVAAAFVIAGVVTRLVEKVVQSAGMRIR